MNECLDNAVPRVVGTPCYSRRTIEATCDENYGSSCKASKLVQTPLPSYQQSAVSVNNVVASSSSMEADSTSTPMLKLSDRIEGARSPLLSPISYDSEPATDYSELYNSFFDPPLEAKSKKFVHGGNVWKQYRDSTAGGISEESAVSDSGYLTKDTRSELTDTTENGPGDSILPSNIKKPELDLTIPLQISIPSPRRKTDSPSPTQEMFMALDQDYHRYIKWLKTYRVEVHESEFDLLSAMNEYDRSGYILGNHLLPLFSPSTLRRMRQVSNKWREIVNRHSKGRWKTRIKMRNLIRRSDGMVRSGPMQVTQRLSESSGGVHQRQIRPVLESWRRNESGSNWRRFVSASSRLLPSEHLEKCPVCSGPSRIQPADKRAVCTDTNCAYDYCTFCCYPYHESRPCVRRISPTRDSALLQNSPEKRQTKKRLKRL